MKKLASMLAVLAAAAVSVHAQGGMTFGNNASALIVSNGVPVVATAAGTPGAGGGLYIGLFYNSNANAPADPFNSNDGYLLNGAALGISSALGAGLFNGGTRTFTGIASGGEVAIQIRVWDRAFGTGLTGYRAAATAVQGGNAPAGTRWAVSDRFVGNLGGGSLPTPDLVLNFGFRGLDVYLVPEPSVLALGFLGAIGTLVLFRRRK